MRNRIEQHTTVCDVCGLTVINTAEDGLWTEPPRYPIQLCKVTLNCGGGEIIDRTLDLCGSCSHALERDIRRGTSLKPAAGPSPLDKWIREEGERQGRRERESIERGHTV